MKLVGKQVVQAIPLLPVIDAGVLVLGYSRLFFAVDGVPVGRREKKFDSCVFRGDKAGILYYLLVFSLSPIS